MKKAAYDQECGSRGWPRHFLIYPLDSLGRLIWWQRPPSQGVCLRLSLTLSSQPNLLINESPHNWSPQYLLSKSKAFFPFPSTPLKRSQVPPRKVAALHQPEFPQSSGSRAQDRRLLAPVAQGSRVPLPQDNEFISSPKAAAPAQPARPGQGVGPSRVLWRWGMAASGLLSTPGQALEIPQGQPHEASNTHEKIALGTVMPPKPGNLLQQAGWGAPCSPPGLTAIADRALLLETPVQKCPRQWPNV